MASVLVNFLNDDKYFSSNKVCERKIKLFRRSKKTLSTTIFLPSWKYSRFWWRGNRSKVFQIYWMKWRALPWISVPWFIDYVLINWLYPNNWTSIRIWQNFHRIDRNKHVSDDFRSSNFQTCPEEHAPGISLDKLAPPNQNMLCGPFERWLLILADKWLYTTKQIADW